MKILLQLWVLSLSENLALRFEGISPLQIIRPKALQIWTEPIMVIHSVLPLLHDFGWMFVLTELQQNIVYVDSRVSALSGPGQFAHHIFGLAVSLRVTVPICLHSKLLTFNGLTGLR